MPDISNPADVLAVMTEVVEEFGRDYVYTAPPLGGCVYVYNSKPSCLVAHVLTRFGVGVDELSANEGKSASEALLHVRGINNQTTVLLLDEAQLAQDQGFAWGEALDEATRVYEGNKNA